MSVSVLILSVDTSSPSGSLAVLREQALIAQVCASNSEPYSSRMFRQLEFLLGEVSLGLEQFDLFAVVAGPGSFTGLRVGLTAAKAWAEAYKKPVVAVSGLEAVAEQAASRAATLVSVLDARRGEVYFGVYARAAEGPEVQGVESVATREEFVAALERLGEKGRYCVVSPGRDMFTGVLAGLDARLAEIELVSPFLAASAGRIGYRRAQRDAVSDALSLDANYVRRSDAEDQAKGTRAG